MRNDPAELDLPPGVREACLRMLLSESPEDKRRVEELEIIARNRLVSIEALVFEALQGLAQRRVMSVWELIRGRS